MNILIIGGTGFIGSEVSRQLLQSGHKITAFHRNIAENLPFEQFCGDCNNTKSLNDCINVINPDCIIHMTAMEKRQIEVLKSAVCGKKPRIIVISSADVYKAFEVVNKMSSADIQPVPLNENSELRNVRNFYPNYEKIDVEIAALEIGSIILRLGMVYGKNDPQKRYGDIIQNMRNSDKLYVPQSVAKWRTCYSGVRNIAHGIVLTAEKGRYGEIYNLADDNPYTELEWYQKIAEIMKWRGEILIKSDESENEQLNFKQDLLLDTSKIRRELGYTEVYSIEQELDEIIYAENTGGKY